MITLLLTGVVLEALPKFVVGGLHADAQAALAVAVGAASALVDEFGDGSGGRAVGVFPAAGVRVMGAGALGGQGGRGQGGQNGGKEGGLELHFFLGFRLVL